MKFCISCGSQNEDNAAFCSACGTAFPSNSVNASKVQTQPKAPNLEVPSKVNSETAAKLAKLFNLAPDEKVIAFMGNSYSMSTT